MIICQTQMIYTNYQTFTNNHQDLTSCIWIHDYTKLMFLKFQIYPYDELFQLQISNVICSVLWLCNVYSIHDKIFKT